ncbi:uncharacterized protein LOC131328463 [Rhododendron vialii]|uniref:uncharacterized protein LOC131328463 n=1 Tax=Rhododendron vialii TaxID=182163 RepID=UPI00265E81E6|nr:uncharacterized protein LOC131328463 [Rhododendron vialii]
MVEENPTMPLDPKNLLGGGGDKSLPKASGKPEGRHGRKATSKGNPLTVQDGSKNREGRTTTESTRRSKSRRERESVAHSRRVHNSKDILDKKRQEIDEFARLIKKREHGIRELERIQEHPEDFGLSRRNSRGDRHAMVKCKKAPSQDRRSRSRSKSRTPGWRKTSSRKRRRRSQSLTPEGKTRKHHRDRYERPDSDWEKSAPNKMKEREGGPCLHKRQHERPSTI